MGAEKALWTLQSQCHTLLGISNLAPFDMDCQKNAGGNGVTAGIKHQSQNGVLRVSVWGSVALSDVTAYVTRHQDEWAAHARVCWDLREFDPSGITSADILNIRHAFAEILDLRSGGRSAVIVSRELNLVTKVAMAMSENRQGPVDVRSFLDPSAALAWLTEQVDD